MPTFLSYSRRQLYFAESIALHLQQAGIDVWFDLQQLTAGTAWSDGLTSGMGAADRLVLMVSTASLASEYTKAEWESVARRGKPIVLVLYEPVVLPEALRGLPCFDFRSGFDSKFKELVRFLKSDGKPRHDLIPTPNRLGVSLKLPRDLRCILLAQFGTFLACLLSLGLAIASDLLSHRSQPLADIHDGKFQFFCAIAGLSLACACRYALPLLRHKLEYAMVRRGIAVALFWWVPAFFGMGNLLISRKGGSPYLTLLVLGCLLAVLAFLLFVYSVMLHRSADLLRWLEPEENLQGLRRRVHQPLAGKAGVPLEGAPPAERRATTYAPHADPADAPFARYVEQVCREEGHTRVTEAEAPERHLAILSNRSSQAWAQKVTQSYAGKLVFLVASTIEFKDSLRETGRYQWVDARDGDQKDIQGLARSLGDPESWKREAALETTPAMIDRWKVPSGVTLLKRSMELFAIYVGVSGLTDLIGTVMGFFVEMPQGRYERAIGSSILLVLLGAAYFWISGVALVYRRVPASWLYGFLVASLALVSWKGSILPQILRKPWWLFPGLAAILILSTAMSCRFWFPAFHSRNPDEVGIQESIDRAFKRRNLLIVSAWVLAIVGLAVFTLLRTEPGLPAK